MERSPTGDTNGRGNRDFISFPCLVFKGQTYRQTGNQYGEKYHLDAERFATNARLFFREGFIYSLLPPDHSMRVITPSQETFLIRNSDFSALYYLPLIRIRAFFKKVYAFKIGKIKKTFMRTFLMLFQIEIMFH